MSMNFVRDRRGFLRQAMAAAGAVALGPTVLRALGSQPSRPIERDEVRVPLGFAVAHADGLGESREHPADCLVLGAGISGVTAARDIAEVTHGRASVIVLEGSDRVGGRMHTIHDVFGTGLSTEEGAEFVHVQPGSGVPIWDEIRRYRLGHVKVPHVERGLVFFGDRKVKKLRSTFLTGLEVPQVWPIFLEIDWRAGADISAREFVERHSYTAHARAMAELALGGHVPGALEEISLEGFRSDHVSNLLGQEADHHVLDGYDSIPRHIAQGLDVRLGHVIERIRYGVRGVEVKLGDGRWFYGRTAVCTFSAGMLASGRIDFDPPLPASKLRALQRIRMGEVSKFVIPFTRSFWPEGMAMLNHPSATRMAGRTYFVPQFGNAQAAPMLTAYMAGEDAQKFRHLTDYESLQRICADLDQIFPEAAPTLSLVLRRGDEYVLRRKQWIDDPFSVGAYSFLTCREGGALAPSQARAALGNSTETHPLFWAGEAVANSWDTHPATVHGAHATGIDAARSVIRHLRSS